MEGAEQSTRDCASVTRPRVTVKLIPSRASAQVVRHIVFYVSFSGDNRLPVCCFSCSSLESVVRVGSQKFPKNVV